MSTNTLNPRIAGIVTAGMAVVVAGMGLATADAFDARSGSFETAPKLSCPSAERDVNVHSAGEQLANLGLTPTQVANTWVVKAASSWTATHFNPLGTTVRPLTNVVTPMSEVDIRDMSMRRIGVFVVTAADGSWVVTRSYQCKTPAL